MAQPSIANYYCNTRKRSAVDDIKSASAKKVLILDNKKLSISAGTNNNDVTIKTVIYPELVELPGKKNVRKIATPRSAKRRKPTSSEAPQYQTVIETFLQRAQLEVKVENLEDKNNHGVQKEVVKNDGFDSIIKNQVVKEYPVQKNAMDNLNFNDIKKKLTRSEKLAALKTSINRFRDGERKLDKIEAKISDIKQSPTIKTFKNIEFDVQLSPQKIQPSPQKEYLSPRKDSSVRRNILNIASPSKNVVKLSFSPSKLAYDTESTQNLQLPYKYRSFLELFRCVDVVTQIMFNRQETVTFKKLKPAVEEMLKRNLLERHMGQIKHAYPEAYDFRREKLREYGAGLHQEKWQLVIHPKLSSNVQHMTSEILLERRRKLTQILLEKTKEYHEEFLITNHEMRIPRVELRRWHPEFLLEKVPDLGAAQLPQAPTEEIFCSGKDVLAKAKTLFQCNTRMEAALERLQEMKKTEPDTIALQTTTGLPTMKGIPKALLEKVRERQQAKMLQNMTRPAHEENQLRVLSRLPEMARVTRNLFVAEKKSVLPLDVVTDKLSNSFRTFLTKSELVEHLRVIAKEAPPGWLVFHEIRNLTYIKLSKNADLNVVLMKLEGARTQKQDSC